MESREVAEPKDLSHHLSRTTKARLASSIKSFYKYFSIPGIGQLAGGLPNDHYFPFDDLEARVALEDRWKTGTNNTAANGLTATSHRDRHAEPTSARLIVPKAAPTPDPALKIDLASALQYGTSQGYPPLYQFVRQFTREHLHPNVPYKGGPEVILTCGSTDGFAKTIQAFNNEWAEGHDPIWAKEGLLVEEFCYMNAVQTARPRGMNIEPVSIDDQGMKAGGKGGLKDVLENWDYSRGKRPHLMYTVTIGQNPTSGTLGVKRRKELYALCQKYDIIIVEDDPYWYLQYPKGSEKTSITTSTTEATARSSGYDFLDSLVPSYLSIDVDGRVVRLDTFSKTVAPGCRLGWITAQPAIVERILRITETSTQQPSGFVQSMIAELLIGPVPGSDKGRGGGKQGKGWGMDGWVRWLEGLRAQYQGRMEEMHDILSEGNTLVKLQQPSPRNVEMDDWFSVKKVQPYSLVRPEGGMFIWLNFDFATHPLSEKVPLPRLARAQWIFWTTPKYRVLVVPGTVFSPTAEIRDQQGWSHFRMCFAAIARDQLRPVTERFVNGVRDFWDIRKVEEIDELLKDDDAAVVDAVQGLRLVDTEGVDALTGFC